MIVTVTVNPSLDRTVDLDGPLLVGAVQSAAGTRDDAGGKGVNVARVVAASGVETLAVLPLAGDDPYAEVLARTGLPIRRVGLTGHARVNLTLAAPDGITTKINLPGVTRTAQDGERLIDEIVAAARGARWLVLAGSVPPGLGDDFYARVISAVRAAGDAPRIAVDTSGPALAAVVAGARPDLIKPNEDELAELVGVALDADADLVSVVHDRARQLVPQAVGAALVTLGAAGAVLVTADGAWHAIPPPTRVRSTVGAGDSSLAGYLLADVSGADPAERVRRGIRYGSAAASLPGTQAPTPADLPTGDVSVRSLTH